MGVMTQIVENLENGVCHSLALFNTPLILTSG